MSRPDDSETEQYRPSPVVEGILSAMESHPRLALLLGHSLSILGGIMLLLFGLPVAILPVVVGTWICETHSPLAGVTTALLLGAWYYRKERFLRVTEFMMDLPNLGAVLVGVGQTGLREERKRQ